MTQALERKPLDHTAFDRLGKNLRRFADNRNREDFEALENIRPAVEATGLQLIVRRIKSRTGDVVPYASFKQRRGKRTWTVAELWPTTGTLVIGGAAGDWKRKAETVDLAWETIQSALGV